MPASLFVVLAWVFVIFRLLQAYVHVTSNKVRLRGVFFGVSALALAIMWIIFIVRNAHRHLRITAMPLDFCHPTAPHKKLRLPEWYVSSLMMDRALDAICRRVKKLDRKHDIPYLAGYSLDGKTIYIDRHMPQIFKFRGRKIDTDRFLILHEEVEKTLIDQLGLHYLHAHQIATRAEEAAVRAAGITGANTIASCRNTSKRSATNGSPKCRRISISSPIATSRTTICCGAC